MDLSDQRTASSQPPMKPILKNGLAGRLQSFRFAVRGIWVMLRSQKNAWVHAALTLTVVIAAALLGVDRSGWAWLILAIVSVWTAEALNTAFEFLADVASPEFHPLVERAKDVAAGAVLITAVGALSIGLLVLGPPLWGLLSRIAL